MQSPSEIDDEKFQVATAAKLSREALTTLQQELVAERAELEKWNAVGGSPKQYDKWAEDYRRKGKQLFWIAHQLGKIKESQKAANRRAHDKEKPKRRQNFYEAFFNLCRRELEPQDFRELCDEARDRAGEGPDPATNGTEPGVVHGRDGDRS